jgi:hypothetical protein
MMLFNMRTNRYCGALGCVVMGVLFAASGHATAADASPNRSGSLNGLMLAQVQPEDTTYQWHLYWRHSENEAYRDKYFGMGREAKAALVPWYQLWKQKGYDTYYGYFVDTDFYEVGR